MSASLYDSLVLGGVIELAGGPGGVVSVNPMCPGAAFTLDPTAWDLGDPQPTTDYVATLVVDGSRPFGDRTDDRTAQITVFIKAPDFLTLAGAEELLLSTLDAQPTGQFTMTWTPRMTQAQINAGQLPLPVVFDCFRAKPSKKKWGGPTGFGDTPVSQIEITFEALPYGRSDTQQQLAFASPVAALNAPAPPAAPVTLDNFSTINSTQFSQSTTAVIGPKSGYWDPAAFGFPDGAGQPLAYSNSFSAPVNMTGMTALKLWVGLGSRYYFNHHPRGRTKTSVTYTLTDTAGQQLSWTTLTDFLAVSQNPTSPAFTPISVRIPQTNPAFNMASVASYELVMTNRGASQLLPGGEFRWVAVTLDALTAYPSTTIAAATTRGTVYDVHGVAGTHRAPVSITANAPPTAGTATVVTATGAGTYTSPGGALYVGATVTGGGGPGATMTVAGIGGGGGGAEEAAEPQLPGSSAGVVIPYTVGAGGGPGTAGQASSFGPVPGQTLVVTANGGLAAVANSPTGALGGSGSTNTQHYPGGPGRTATGGLGGGGGSSAGTAAPGNTPVGTSSTTYTSSSSFTIPSGGAQVTLGLTGAGGGGGGGWNGAAGGGGGYLPVSVFLPAGTYPFTIGAAGSAGSSGSNGSNGGSTTITIGSVTYTAHGGQGGAGSDWYGSGGGSGGLGSAGEEPGGSGGDGYPYCGGGGSSAGPGQAGNAGSNGYATPGVAPTGGGNGGAGAANNSSNGSAGSVPGGGGGGARATGHSGGAGAGGQLVVAYSTSGAPTSSGATAPGGGGAGGAGGATAGTAGSAGSQPGGGGGGGNSSGATEAGGFGGNGQITITPYQYGAFATLLLHRPGLLAPPSLNPLVVIGGVPGATEYPVASLVSGVNAQFNGTYTVLLAFSSFNTPSAARTISVTVNQYEASGGTKWSTTTTSLTITPNSQVINGLVVAGNLTLPYKAVPKDNSQCYYTVQVTDSNTSDAVYDVLFLDNNGQTALINEGTSGYKTYGIDEPDSKYDLGLHWGSQSDRTQAISVSDALAALGGGPLTLEPGDNKLLAWSLAGTPSLAVSLFPRWFHQRLE